jgi:exosome complex RNA-binding protein Rrp4
VSLQEEGRGDGLIEAKREPVRVIEYRRDGYLPEGDELVIGRVGKIPLQVGRRGWES